MSGGASDLIVAGKYSAAGVKAGSGTFGSGTGGLCRNHLRGKGVGRAAPRAKGKHSKLAAGAIQTYPGGKSVAAGIRRKPQS